MPEPDPEHEEHLRRYGRPDVINRHDALEQMIGETPFLVDDHPTLADGVLIGVARWLEFHQVAPRQRWPKLHALRQRIEALPEVTYAIAIENGETPMGSGVMLGQIPLAEVIERFGTAA